MTTKDALACIFVTMEVESSSTLAAVLSAVLKSIIAIAVISYLVSTEPAYRVIPFTCIEPACRDDPFLCPNADICPSQTSPGFAFVEDFCVYIFTAEYILRLLTCWTVTPRVAGILPNNWKESHTLNEPQPKYSIPYTMIKFMLRIPNLIDLFCFLPAYVEPIIDIIPGVKQNTTYAKVNSFLRLLRVLRLFNAIHFIDHVAVVSKLIKETFVKAGFVLAVFLFFALIIVVLLSGMIFVIERGRFTVNHQYPEGQYIRPTADRQGTEVSPFYSAPVSMYWVIATCTTVGYGDFYPTSEAGQAVACVCALLGITFFAFPIGVLSSEFKLAYDDHYENMKSHLREKRKEVNLEANMCKRDLEKNKGRPLVGSLAQEESSMTDAKDRERCKSNKRIHIRIDNIDRLVVTLLKEVAVLKLETADDDDKYDNDDTNVKMVKKSQNMLDIDPKDVDVKFVT